jgi:hypothetical protein
MDGSYWKFQPILAGGRIFEGMRIDKNGTGRMWISGGGENSEENAVALEISKKELGGLKLMERGVADKRGVISKDNNLIQASAGKFKPEVSNYTLLERRGQPAKQLGKRRTPFPE